MKCPTGALELKWEVSREKWKCFDIFMFFSIVSEELEGALFCNFDKRCVRVCLAFILGNNLPALMLGAD